MWLGLLLACAPDDDCAAMCDAAAERYASCLDERGLSWGPQVGYDSPEDYDDWCDTWAWEQRQLGTESVCEAMLPAFRDGDCDAYYAAWASP